MFRCIYEPYNNSNNNNYSFMCDDNYYYYQDIYNSRYDEYYDECDLLEKYNLEKNLDLNLKLTSQSSYNHRQKNRTRDIHKLFWKKQLAKRYQDNIDPLTKATNESLARVNRKRSKDKRKSQKRARPILVE
jgi:hypothetical protein